MNFSTPDKIGRCLLYGGWAVLLAYLPSGWLHQELGKFVYLRDFLLGLHLFGSILFFSKNGQLRSFFSKVWPLAILPIFLAPALFNAETRIEMAGYIKWFFIWIDCIILGRLASQYFQWTKTARILTAVLTLTLLADLATGIYELHSNTFAIAMKGQLSPFGVELGKEGAISRFIRVKGLQRDVFSFANLMGLSVVGGLCVLVFVGDTTKRILAGVWVTTFSIVLFASGGRSAFFGVGAAFLLSIGLLLYPENIRKYFSRIALGWLGIALLTSFVGIGDFTEWFSTTLMKGSHIGDARSAHMRDDNWRGVRDAIGNVPIVLFTGSPLGSMIDGHVTPIFHWADNNYLWLLYHGSFISLAAIIFYFRNVLSRSVPLESSWSRDSLMLFLLFIMGEAIARESLSFLGCMPLFIACGYVEGTRIAAPGLSRSDIRRGQDRDNSGQVKKTDERRKKTEAERLAERISKRSGYKSK